MAHMLEVYRIHGAGAAFVKNCEHASAEANRTSNTSFQATLDFLSNFIFVLKFGRIQA
jgi:hypothetical protein